MNCSSCKGVWVQMGVIVALGAAIGVADAYKFRKLDLQRPAPPPLPPITVSQDPPKGDPTKPATDAGTNQTTSGSTPATNTTPHSSPTPAPAAGTSASTAFEFTPKEKMPTGHITVDEAKGLYDQQATFIDTRKSDVYQAGHVLNAFRIELAMFSAGDPPMLAMVPRDAIVVAYCSGGHCDESEAVARMLDASGYKKVYVMHDGFPGWKAKGFPIETGKGLDQ